MKKLFLMLGAATMALSVPAMAGAQGKGKGASAKSQQSMSVKRNAKSNGQVRTDVRARTDARAAARAKTRTGASVNRMRDTNGDRILDSRDRVDLNGDGIADGAQNRYGGNACPPGLAKKSPACIPPGQAKRMFTQGQQLPNNYNYFSDYNSIPEPYRTQIPFSDSNRYIYRDGQVYVVDPTTRIVTSIINLIR